jgi:hypothetical protein
MWDLFHGKQLCRFWVTYQIRQQPHEDCESFQQPGLAAPSLMEFAGTLFHFYLCRRDTPLLQESRLLLCHSPRSLDLTKFQSLCYWFPVFFHGPSLQKAAVNLLVWFIFVEKEISAGASIQPSPCFACFFFFCSENDSKVYCKAMHFQ